MLAATNENCFHSLHVNFHVMLVFMVVIIWQNLVTCHKVDEMHMVHPFSLNCTSSPESYLYLSVLGVVKGDELCKIINLQLNFLFTNCTNVTILCEKLGERIHEATILYLVKFFFFISNYNNHPQTMHKTIALELWFVTIKA